MKRLLAILILALSFHPEGQANFLGECPKTIGNWYLCARYLEERLQKTHPQLLSRAVKDELALNLKNGKKKIYRDKEHNYYAVPKYFSDIGFALIFVQYYEGGTYYLLNVANGTQWEAEGYPVLSPDGKRIAVFQKDIDTHYVKNVLRIYKIVRLGLILEFNVYPDDWGPSNVEWVNDDELRFSKDSIDKVNPGYYELKEPKTLKFQNGKWTIQ